MKDYKKKYEDLRKNIEHMYESVNPEWKRIIERYIPEIKECEDEEEIRKELIKLMKQMSNTIVENYTTIEISTFVAWLEKQTIDISSFPEEQKKYMEKYVNLDKTTLVKLLAERDENINEILKKPKFKAGDVISDGSSTVTIDGINKDGYIISNGETESDSNAVNWIIRFEDQDRWKLLEQNKVEPKFRIGDWVVYDGVTYLITEVYDKDGYTNDHQGFNQDEMRLWDFFKDAKNGDVLCAYSSDHDCIFLYQNTDEVEPNKNVAVAYCCIDVYENKIEFGIQGPDCIDIRKIKPATKEQRELLLEKIVEAGFIWDPEKKELKKIEQKFEIEKGKWYVCNTPRYTDFVVGKAYYCPKNGMLKPEENGAARYVAKHCFHPWTIKDARDGDVLAAEINEEPNDFIYIFKKYDQNLGFWSHCYLDAYTNKFHRGIYHNNYNVGVPAAKEQCNLLFQKMKESGYEWDAEKKELRKIEQTYPQWTGYDEKAYEIALLDIDKSPSSTKNDTSDWLKSLKKRIQSKQKQDWNNDDELIYQHCLTILYDYGYDNWFKERMKGE